MLLFIEIDEKSDSYRDGCEPKGPYVPFSTGTFLSDSRLTNGWPHHINRTSGYERFALFAGVSCMIFSSQRETTLKVESAPPFLLVREMVAHSCCTHAKFNLFSAVEHSVIHVLLVIYSVFFDVFLNCFCLLMFVRIPMFLANYPNL